MNIENTCTCTDECAGGYNPNCICTSSECRYTEEIPDRGAKKERILNRLRTLGIEELASLDNLNELSGDYINLECRLPNGKTEKLLDDSKKYFANQVEQANSDKCYGIASDGEQIAVYQYGCNGADAELVAWVKL